MLMTVQDDVVQIVGRVSAPITIGRDQDGEDHMTILPNVFVLGKFERGKSWGIGSVMVAGKLVHFDIKRKEIKQ
jgi:hypothetical protein